MTKKRKPKELADLLGEILEIIEGAERRAMAYDGPVPDTVDALQDSELTRIYRLAKRAKARATRLAENRRTIGGKRPRLLLEELDEEKLARAILRADQTEVLYPFRRSWESLTRGRRDRYAKSARRLKVALFQVGALA